MFTHSKEYKIDPESSANNVVFEKCGERCLQKSLQKTDKEFHCSLEKA